MQGSSYAPLQFLRSPWNRDVYTAIDNQVDGRTTLVLYLGSASTLPDELQKYNVGCILIHKDEKQIYLNTGNDTTPTWESFGPGTNTLPTPFLPGQYLSNDGVDTFWTLIDLATGVTGLLDSDHIDLADLANNSDFIDYLIANSYFTDELANDPNFISQLTSNVLFQTAVSSFVSGSGQTQIDQTPDNGTYGLLSGAVDGTNDTFTVSLTTYASGTLQVFLNGMIQEQGAGKDWVELTPNAGTFKFNTPPTVSSVITVVYNKVVTVINEYKVGATITDTTPKYLNSKFEIVSADSSINITKTIQNPAGDEKISYDLSVNTSGGTGTKIQAIAGEVINGSSDPKAVFIGTNKGVDYTSTLGLTPTYDLYQSSATGVLQNYLAGSKYAYKIDSGKSYSMFTIRNVIGQNTTVPITVEIYNTGTTEPTGSPILSENYTIRDFTSGSNDEVRYLNDTIDCTQTLGGGNNYWMVVTFGSYSGTVLRTYRGTAGSPNELVWNGSAWVSASSLNRCPAVELQLLPILGYVYNSRGNDVFGDGFVGDTPDGYVSGRKCFLGFLTQNAVKGDTVDIYIDGKVTFATALIGTETKNIQLGTSLGSIDTYNSKVTPTQLRVGTRIGDNEIIINKNSTVAMTIDGQYQ